jgi:ABC-type branched-subunit amino acid transport system ATPase component
MGRNGVGTTPTLRSITGLAPIEKGVMRLNSRELNGPKADQRARLGIGYVVEHVIHAWQHAHGVPH